MRPQAPAAGGGAGATSGEPLGRATVASWEPWDFFRTAMNHSCVMLMLWLYYGWNVVIYIYAYFSCMIINCITLYYCLMRIASIVSAIMVHDHNATLIQAILMLWYIAKINTTTTVYYNMEGSIGGRGGHCPTSSWLMTDLCGISPSMVALQYMVVTRNHFSDHVRSVQSIIHHHDRHDLISTIMLIDHCL